MGEAGGREAAREVGLVARNGGMQDTYAQMMILSYRSAGTEGAEAC